MRISGVVLVGLALWASAGCSPDSLPGVSLLVEQPTLKMPLGTEAEVPVSIVRKGGFEGPVQVELKGLPSGAESVQVRIPSGESSAVLHLSTVNLMTAGTHPVDVVATAPGMSDIDRLTLELTETSGLTLPKVSLDPATPTVMKGKSREVSLVVDRTGDAHLGFWVEPDASRPWMSFEPVFVPRDATHVTLQVTVDEHQLVGLRELYVRQRVGTQTAGSWLKVEVVGPQEEAPQLTAVDPQDALAEYGTRITLTGTGLSSTASLTLRATWSTGVKSSAVTLVSATSTEVNATLQWPWRWIWSDPPSAVVLEVGTPTGTATVPFTFFPLYVDPATGSDETGRGTPSSPFASLQRAMNFCRTCSIFLAPGLHHPGDVEVPFKGRVEGTGELYGDNPTVLEGAGEERFIVEGGTLRNVKVIGYTNGVSAVPHYYNLEVLIYPTLENVWVIKP